MKKIILIFVLGLFINTSFAQRHKGGHEAREKIKQFHKQFMEEQLNISGSEAEKFWAVFDKYDAERKAVKKEMNSLKKGFNALSDKELDEALKKYFTLKEKETAIDKKYFEEFKKVLSIRQIAVFYQAENKFKRVLIAKLRERMGGKTGEDLDDFEE